MECTPKAQEYIPTPACEPYLQSNVSVRLLKNIKLFFVETILYLFVYNFSHFSASTRTITCAPTFTSLYILSKYHIIQVFS